MANSELQTKAMDFIEIVTDGNGYDLPFFKQRSHDAHINHMNQLAMPGPDYSILLLGDSMFENLNTRTEFLDLFRQHNVFNAGVGGDRICFVNYRLDQGLINHSPRLKAINYVLILIGTNDLKQKDCSKENLMIGIRALIHCIKNSLPHACIQIARILNRNDWVDIRVDAANEAIGEACQLELIEFVSLGDYVKQIDFEDHVHLNENGYQKFFHSLKRLFEEKQIK